MSIDELNISIFDFIFNVNMLKNISNYSDYTDALDTMIMEQTNSDTNYEFWQEYNYMISNSSLKDISTLDGYHYAYFPFPKMTMTCVNTYLDYKLAQSKKILEDNFNYDLENLGDDLNITNNFALKKVIDYLIDKRILTQNGEYAKMNILGDFEFDFENLKINSLKQKESPLFNQTIVNNNGTMAYSYNGNSIVNIQNQDDLFKIVLEKIEAMKAENIPEEKLDELIKSCKKKDSSKVISLLQTLAVEVSSSLIVKGILMMFGIPS